MRCPLFKCSSAFVNGGEEKHKGSLVVAIFLRRSDTEPLILDLGGQRCKGRGKSEGIGVGNNNTENLALILLSRDAVETLERPEVQANGERAGRPGEVSGRSYGRYFWRWMHLS